jgi:hypothetical protein
MSSLSWMDFSEHDRQRALDLIDQLDNDSDTRDELGIGTIRDALAELLFPGTSTIQTRAKYFLFIPWIYKMLERRKIPSNRIGIEARHLETELIKALMRSDDTDGVIGKEAGDKLKRLPSSVYWQGLHRWGIRQIELSQQPYHRAMDRLYTVKSQRAMKTDDGEVITDLPDHWHPGLPPIPKDFPVKASFRLSREEAAYLRDRISSRVPESMLAFLVKLDQPFAETTLPWQEPLLSTLPPAIVKLLRHAQKFSLMMHGAALLYNLMLAQKSENMDGLAGEYAELLAGWWDEVGDHKQDLLQWDRPGFWTTVKSQGARIHPNTEKFVEQWIGIVLDALVKDASVTAISEAGTVRLLIKNREIQIKPGKARLHHAHALRLWSGESGTGRLSYRWPTTHRIVLDILNGLSDAGGHTLV